jgi:Lon protease-like protein
MATIVQMNGHFPDRTGAASLEAVPLFPLPNVVLFPNALLPLHVFEERYKAMTVDALAGRRQIAMALLSPSWEKCYYGQPAIEKAVCVATIVSHERLADGKFNVLLRGELRATIDRELRCPSTPGARLYRVAHLSPVVETDIMEIDLSHERERLQTLLTEGCLARLPLVKQIGQLLRGAMRTADIADLLSFHLLDDIALKQSILGDGDIRRRVNRLISALSCSELAAVDQSLQDTAGSSDPSRN